MPYIKKLVLKGFKSFAHETEIPFENSMNIFVGPNGSGKSNIADAICFVLGRLSIKSMRAAKASSLIFAGTKAKKPSYEASIKLFFDNSDNGFSIDKKEILIERIVRRNGQGIYKINDETKSRQEVLELLAHAGIDPYGFNIVLQGTITEVVKMQAEERRKVIEDVAGISVYETRKEKSLHELEKTDERLKEVNAILRERTAYLRNLEQERQQALRFKQLDETIKRCKATLINKSIEEKEKELSLVSAEIEKHNKEKKKIKEKINQIQDEISKLEEKINQINVHIQKSTGLEQEKLHDEITSLKSQLAASSVKKENFENRINEIRTRRSELNKNIETYEKEIQELKKESPLMAKKQEELRKKREEVLKIEDQRKRFYSTGAEILSLKERINEKTKQISRIKAESEIILKNIDSLAEGIELTSLDKLRSIISDLRTSFDETNKLIEEEKDSKSDLEKTIFVFESETKRLEKIKADVKKLDVCPLCQSRITETHISHVNQDCDKKIEKIKQDFNQTNSKINKHKENIEKLSLELANLKKTLEKKESDFIKIRSIDDKKETIKRLYSDEKSLVLEIDELTKRKEKLEKQLLEIKEVEEKYDNAILEIEEISSRTEENLDTTILYKERELENIKNIIRRSIKEETDTINFLKELDEQLTEKTALLKKREKEEEELSKKFKKLFEERSSIQQDIHEKSTEQLSLQHNLQNVDNITNEFKIKKARFDAEKESFDIEFKEFQGVQIIKGSKEFIKEKLERSQKALITIGSVNMRALEVYDSVKGEYEEVYQKVEVLNKEKVEIMKIIEEIDKKKKKALFKTLYSINELFNRNFSQLSTKGEAFLEIENKEEPFEGGLNITIKVGKGKFFDVTSLSGGEQTLVALSLIFAIQEYKPYSFYIFDEVDAALDKRNSERLAALIKRFMKTGQYIIITHNDAIITESTRLYGVSMQDGVSKILSLEI